MKKSDQLENLSRLLPQHMDPAFESEELVDLIEDNWNYLSKLGINFKTFLGCGSFGCAFPMKDPNIIAKFTADENEIEYYNLGKEYSAKYPIFPKVSLIVSLDDEWFLVLREAIKPLSENEFFKNVRKIKSKLKSLGLEIEDIRGPNIGRSVIDNRLVLFDGRVFL